MKNHHSNLNRTALILPLFALLFLSTFARADYVLFYAGDFNPMDPNANALANENDAVVPGNPYGAATYQNFIVSGTWHVHSLFTNNLSDITPNSAYWELRIGMSQGNGGTLIAAGTGTTSSGTFTWTPTARSGFGYDEYTAHVTGLDLTLSSGQYWMSVVPQAPNDYGRSFNSNTFDCFNSSCIGTQLNDQQYFNSAFFGANFDNGNDWGVFQRFSSGVDGYDTPEPSSLLMLGSGVAGMGGLLRRRLLA
jgi:hypothetical protein